MGESEADRLERMAAHAIAALEHVGEIGPAGLDPYLLARLREAARAAIPAPKRGPRKLSDADAALLTEFRLIVASGATPGEAARHCAAVAAADEKRAYAIEKKLMRWHRQGKWDT